MQCKRCGRHERIFVFERDGKTNKGWYIERCKAESCSYNFDIYTVGEYRELNKKRIKDNPPYRNPFL